MKRVAPLFAVLLAVGVPAVSAEPTPQEAYKVRHDFFEELGSHMKSSSLILKGKEGKAEDLPKHAAAILEHGKKIATAFPAGSDKTVVPKTRALSKIWEDPEGFAAAAKRMVDAAEKLVEVAAQDDLAAFKAQFGAVGQSCGSCHDDYREEKE